MRSSCSTANVLGQVTGAACAAAGAAHTATAARRTASTRARHEIATAQRYRAP